MTTIFFRYKKNLIIGEFSLQMISSLAKQNIYHLCIWCRLEEHQFKSKEAIGHAIYLVSYKGKTSIKEMLFKLWNLDQKMPVISPIQEWLVLYPVRMERDVVAYIALLKEVGARQGFNIPEPNR